jgi:hypothetical protein
MRATDWWVRDISRLNAAAAKPWAVGVQSRPRRRGQASFNPMGLQPMLEIGYAYKLTGRRCWYSVEMGFLNDLGEQWTPA